MKKRILAAACAALLLLGSASAVELYVDGSRLAPDVPPVLTDGRTLVPMRSLFEALGASVSWDGATATASARKDGASVQVTAGSTAAYQNGTACTLDVPAQLIQGRTMVPARFVSEALGARVLWDGAAQTVYVLTPGHASLVVEYLDVGQADSILLSSGGEAMLIDAGNNADGSDVADYVRQAGVTRLKYAVGTHAHADHIGGLDDVIKAMDVDNVLLPRATSNTQTYRDVLDAIDQKNLTVTVPKAGDTYTLGNARVTVVAAQDADDLNNTSLVLKAQYGDTSFLFMGDAEAEVENAILAAGTDVKSNVLKAGHHGSNTSTTAAFLAAVSPEAAVISCGANNSYGHPSPDTLNRLAGVKVWRTDQNGTIIAMTDGKRCVLTAERAAASQTPVKTPAQPVETPTETPAPAPSTPSPSAPAGPAQSGTVYVTPTGKRYHILASCAGKNASPATLSEALARGLTPCQKCAA